MSYAEIIVRDCNDTYIIGKHRGFPEILFLATKMHALKIQTESHDIVFVRFIVKLLDITRLFNMFLQKRNEIQVKNFDADQLTCGVQFN